jgi:hypothetical protein
VQDCLSKYASAFVADVHHGALAILSLSQRLGIAVAAGLPFQTARSSSTALLRDRNPIASFFSFRLAIGARISTILFISMGGR